MLIEHIVPATPRLPRTISSPSATVPVTSYSRIAAKSMSYTSKVNGLTNIIELACIDYVLC